MLDAGCWMLGAGFMDSWISDLPGFPGLWPCHRARTARTVARSQDTPRRPTSTAGRALIGPEIHGGAPPLGWPGSALAGQWHDMESRPRAGPHPAQFRRQLVEVWTR